MIELVYPQIIALILVPLFLLGYLLLTKKGKVLGEFSDEVLERLEAVRESYLGRKSRLTILLLALVMMVLALSRPVINHGEKEVTSKGAEFVTIIDISRSMLAKDLYPNRLEFAKVKLKEFIGNSSSDKIGVIGYAGGSFLVSPLTEDKETLIYLIDSLDSARISIGGSNLLNALISADEMLKTEKRAVVLFSDGGESDYKEEIEFIKEKDLKIFSVGIGTPGGAPIPLREGGFIKDKGNIVVSSLNEKLKDLALESQGGYIEGGLGESDMKKLYQAITSQLNKKDHEKKKINDYTELFYYPLYVAVLLLLIGFHSLPKRGVVVSLFMALFLQTPSYSLSFDFKTMDDAKNLYEEGEYKEALKKYSNIQSPSTSQQEKISYNIGNAKYKLGDFEGAIESYENALKIDPKDEDAKHNLEVAKKALQKKKEQQKKQNNDKKNQDNKENKDQQDKKSDSQENKKQNSEKKQSQEKKEQQQSQKKSENKQDSQANQGEEVKKKSAKERKNEHWLKKMEDIRNPIPLKQLKQKQESTNENPW